MNVFKRRFFLAIVHLSIALIVNTAVGAAPDFGGSARLEHQQQKPNVIFILVDDMGWGDLGVFHQNRSQHQRKHKTPFLDRMANEGLQMRAHYCPAPVCAPSRASLLTGVHQGHASIRNNQFDKVLLDNHTLGTVMQAAGYKTAMIGKYGLQGQGTDSQSWPGYPAKRGFDEFFGYVRHVDGHTHYPADDWPLGNSEKHKTGKEVWWNDKEVSRQLAKCYTTDLFTARSKKWIVEHLDNNPEQPFFLFLAYDTPHAALQLPTVAYPNGKGIKAGLQWTGQHGAMINTAEGTIDSFRHPDYVELGWSDAEERFATMVRRIDSAVGDLLQTLNDLKIAENTLVIFTSDNGPHHESYLEKVEYNADSFQSYGPFDGTKRDTWEGGIRMPTLAWRPGFIPARSIDHRASQFHDWMPTLAQLGGISPPARTDGVSLVSTLSQKGKPKNGTVYVEYNHNGRTKMYSDFSPNKQKKKRGEMQVIHLDGFKGIRHRIQSHSTPFEIYDLNQDPGEEHNLAESAPEFIELQQKMKNEVLRLRIPNSSAKRPYDGEPIPGLINTTLSSGVASWQFVKGEFPYVPKFHSAPLGFSSVKAGQGSAAIGGPMPNGVYRSNLDTPGVMNVLTYIEAKSDGQFTLEFNCSSKAFVRIHQASIFDADHGYLAGTTLVKKLKLGKGIHPVQITFLTHDEDDQKASFSLRTK